MFRASRQKFLRGRGAAHRGPTPSVCRQFFQPCALFLRLETENNVAELFSGTLRPTHVDLLR